MAGLPRIRPERVSDAATLSQQREAIKRVTAVRASSGHGHVVVGRDE
jgi:hypothetical protein